MTKIENLQKKNKKKQKKIQNFAKKIENNR